MPDRDTANPVPSSRRFPYDDGRRALAVAHAENAVLQGRLVKQVEATTTAVNAANAVSRAWAKRGQDAEWWATFWARTAAGLAVLDVALLVYLSRR